MKIYEHGEAEQHQINPLSVLLSMSMEGPGVLLHQTRKTSTTPNITVLFSVSLFQMLRLYDSLSVN